jgi:hypothetical protein
MKRMYKYFLLSILASAIPLTASIGQEKKNEQKIKVIINDGSGEKTVLDTTFTGGKMPEKIMLKDGPVIYLDGKGMAMKHISAGEGTGKVFVTVSSDDDGKKEIEKKVIVVRCDSVNISAKPGEKHVVVYDASKASGKAGGTVVIKSDGHMEEMEMDDDNDEEKVIIIRDGKVIENSGEKTFHISVETGDNDTDVEKTKYVIAKNGFVVTVEGNDEAKAKELIKEIESKLGVAEEGNVKPEVVKEETKKSVKK